MGEATIPTPISIKFLFGGTAGKAATCFVQPLDLVKTRMQVNKGVEGAVKPSTFSVISNIIKNEGISTFYTGLTAGLLRQATYTTTRLGIYTWLFENFSTEGVPPGFFMKAALGRSCFSLGNLLDPLIYRNDCWGSRGFCWNSSRSSSDQDDF